MNEFFHAAFAMPTAIWSVLLIPVILYWLMVILGALDLDILDFGGDAGDVGDVGDFADGGDAGDVGDAGDTDVDGGVGAMAKVLSSAGLSGVPLTVSLSLVVLLAWFVTFTAMELLGGKASILLAIGLMGVAGVLSVAVTSVAVRPLRPLFQTRGATGHHELIGQVCTVTTLRVDEDYGQAEILDEDGSPILIQVRCREGAALRRGSHALIFDYDKPTAVFRVTAAGDDLTNDS